MYKSIFYTKILGFSWAYNYNDIWNLIIRESCDRTCLDGVSELFRGALLFSMTPLVNVSSVADEVGAFLSRIFPRSVVR